MKWLQVLLFLKYPSFLYRLNIISKLYSTLISMYLVFLFLSLTILRPDRRFDTLNFHSNVYGLADDQPSFLDPPNHGHKSL